MPIAVHLLSSDDYEFTADDERTIVSEARRTEPEVRTLLRGLRGHLNLVITTGDGVIPESGEVGFAASPDVVNRKVDAARGAADVAGQHLRHMLFHEFHHCVRLIRIPSYYAEDWYDGSVFEGLATVFEREAGWSPPFGEYPESEIAAWG